MAGGTMEDSAGGSTEAREAKKPMTEEERAALVKKNMTEEERLALAKKLDDDLDDFINSLEKKRYTDGWSEDRWEEEMDKHPFFMKAVPDSPDQMSPLVEGLAKLKYDPEENTREELATNYKDDGNFHFKHKNYRMAVIGYSEGIKQKSENADLNATLYQNRATAQYYLQNYRSALIDSEKALKYAPDYYKAQYRAAKSAYSCSKYELCINYCQKILETRPDNKEIIELLTKAKKNMMVQERDDRKKKKLLAMKLEQQDLIIKTIKERGIRIHEWIENKNEDLSGLQPQTSQTIMPDEMVQIEDGILKWPVLLVYPEYKVTDFIKSFAENIPIMSEIANVFPAPWDEEGKYFVGNINVYYEGFNQKIFPANPNRMLKDIMIEKYFEVKHGLVSLIIFARGSPAEKKFLDDNK